MLPTRVASVAEVDEVHSKGVIFSEIRSGFFELMG